MPRQILSEEHIHPAIRGFVASTQSSVVTEVRAAAAANAVLVVGMRGNPVCRRARKLLSEAKNVDRLAAFPMVFVRGALVGGADDLAKLITSGELATLLK
jgi:monothiol glutaredoxin